MVCYFFTVGDFHLLLSAQSPGALPYLNFRFVCAPQDGRPDTSFGCARQQIRDTERVIGMWVRGGNESKVTGIPSLVAPALWHPTRIPCRVSECPGDSSAADGTLNLALIIRIFDRRNARSQERIEQICKPL
jgi:hypothetical protein